MLRLTLNHANTTPLAEDRRPQAGGVRRASHGGHMRAVAHVSLPAVSRRAMLLLLCAVATWSARGGEAVAVAAASNLIYALEALHAEFRRAEPEVTLTLATGASGSLVAQIRHGAPYDVFLSADMEYPRALVAAGAAEPESLGTFAVGRLVVWTRREDLPADLLAALVRPEVRRIAIANPQTAPYGRAALEVLEHLELTASVRPRLVIGENITQTAQFVETGNAELGFVARSLVLSPRLREIGRWQDVPVELHGRLEHGVVLTRRGAARPAAQRYRQFLVSPAAQAVFARFGYEAP